MWNVARKLLLTLLLTLLIWTWAYMALEEKITKPTTLHISPATDNSLLVSFVNQPEPIVLDVTLKGPASRIATLQERLDAAEGSKEKERLDFYFNAGDQGWTQPGIYTLNILQFLRNSPKLEKLGLSVEIVDIEAVEVRVDTLEEKWLDVVVRNENNIIVPHEIVEPARVQMFVPPEWTGELLRASATLTEQQIQRARRSPINARPYIEPAPGRRRWYSDHVTIKLPSTEEEKTERVLQPTIGYVFSPNMQGRYQVELLNENQIAGTTQFLATDDAWQAYETQTLFEVLIEVRDGDENSGEVQRPVVYNFPPEFVRRNEIELIGETRVARFRLVPVEAAQPTP